LKAWVGREQTWRARLRILDGRSDEVVGYREGYLHAAVLPDPAAIGQHGSVDDRGRAGESMGSIDCVPDTVDVVLSNVNWIWRWCSPPDPWWSGVERHLAVDYD
jgi:hypothetical protein